MNQTVILSLLFFGLQGIANPLQSYLDRAIRAHDFNPDLLERSVILATNLARERQGLSPLTSESRLRRSAIRMSSEQSERKTLSHTSLYAETRHLSDRLKREGIQLSNVTMGENLGVDYVLQIADRYFTIDTSTGAPIPMDAETNAPIPNFTYRQFGKAMVEHWLGSPGHREILLNPKFEWIGVGAVLGDYQGFESIYVTQHFLGRIRPSD